MNIVILTGAGISAESGLGTFRDEDGLWSRFRIEDVATPSAFARDPHKVHAFYNLRRAAMRAAQPNAAHRALADLERRHAGRFLLVSQNVDDLHRRAGSRRVVAMHGALDDARCGACGHVWTAPDSLDPLSPCPACAAQASRPDVVWFGEPVRHLEQIVAAVERADLFALIGTSGNVHPAAGLMAMARAHGAATVEMNLEPSEVSDDADRLLLGPASQVVPRWVAGIA